ncbi:MAG: sigma-70 family RNA polymerase sigma factor [OM182 bacterium]|uniref:Sigma-70 family RNA polymerase sigma factor n=1 Tax=OM182 bacterium TaxID=2510334 RepID=A0A520RTB1_9GAMM|nr:MAG: sigma-70 family RNA polymerase sigma factor [OM182 bacterium]
MTDEELMLAVSKGDQSAYQTLVSQHLNAISHYAFRLLGNRKDTEDICQEVFLKLWTNASKWQPEKAKLTTWLHRITHNLCIDYLRKHGRTHTSDTLDIGAAEHLLETPQSDEQNESIAIDEKQRLNHAISLLPETQRSALMLCHYAGFSNKEAAAIMNVSVKALESSIARARRSLRTQLESRDLHSTAMKPASGEINSEEKAETIG